MEDPFNAITPKISTEELNDPKNAEIKLILNEIDETMTLIFTNGDLSEIKSILDERKL